jgi:hypothetical protein
LNIKKTCAKLRDGARFAFSKSRFLRPMPKLFICLALLLATCTAPERRSVAPAFYHWQTTLALSAAECDYLKQFSCKKLYIKVLDVGKNAATGEIEPYARLEIADTTGLAGLQIVPTVFLTNEVFQNISPEKTAWLAGKVAEALAAFPAFGGAREVQFDCDWTASTRAAFFLFLQKTKTRLPLGTRLSATIRLHQYRWPERTGVPPADRGMLMFYNTGDLENPDGGNSIFDARDALPYLRGAARHYPLPLDLALPVFSWALVYRAEGLWKIIPGTTVEAFGDTSKFAAQAADASRFHLRKGTFAGGHYLRPGDRLRVEAIAPEQLLEAARLASQVDLADDATLAFFHLDSTALRRYPAQLLDSVCQTIRFPLSKK